MKKILGVTTVCLMLLLFSFPVEAATFISGSTGADGVFNCARQEFMILKSEKIG
jgi:hypothetical protein